MEQKRQEQEGKGREGKGKEGRGSEKKGRESARQSYLKCRQEIHNGQKIYPLLDGEKESMPSPKKKRPAKIQAPLITSHLVNKAFVIAFPIAFMVFICYMVIKVVMEPSGMKDIDGELI